MRGPRTSAEKVLSCAVGAVAVWFLTIAVGFSPRRNLPSTVEMAAFEIAWLSFPGLVVGAFWAARGPNGRFPLFAAAVTAAGVGGAAPGLGPPAAPLGARAAGVPSPSPAPPGPGRHRPPPPRGAPPGAPAPPPPGRPPSVCCTPPRPPRRARRFALTPLEACT